MYASVGALTAVAGAVGAIVLRIVDPSPVLPSTFGFGDTALVGFAVLGVSFASVGALLVVRRPGNIIGWIMVAIGIGYAVGVFWAAVTFSLAAHPSAIPWLDLRATAWLTVLFTSIGGLVFALGFIFPTGRGQTPTWDRWLKVAAVLSPVMFISVFLIRPGALHVFPTIDNPFGFGLDLRPWLGEDVSERISAMAVFFVPLVVWSIVDRYRRAGRVERQQIKWVGLATALTIAALGIAGASASLSDRPSEFGLALFGFAGALIPVAIGIAILRNGLYDIDRIISRTLSYAAVTAILGVVFIGLILLSQGLLAGITGNRGIPVAISTLAVFALFQPVLRRVRRAVDRHFDRARYDGERTAGAFAERLRWETDMERVTGDLRATVADAVSPSGLDIWLRAGRPNR